MRIYLFPLLLFLCVAPALSQVQGRNDNASSNSSILTTETAEKQCDCYLVSGPDQGYFQRYQLWDFRHAPGPREIPPSEQPLEDHDGGIEDGETGQDSIFGSNVLPLSSSTFAKDWKTQNWRRQGTAIKPIPLRNSIRNIFFAKDPPGSEEETARDSYLVLHTKRYHNYTSSAEIESRLTNIFHCSLRVRFRLLPYGGLSNRSETDAKSSRHEGTDLTPSGPPKGACAGIFTYHTSGSESDIEILTKESSNIVHYANQPDYDPETDTSIPGASTIAAIPTPWTEWSTHRLDWFSNVSAWWVDGHMQTSKSYMVPSMPSTLVMNLWSDGGDWTGDMTVGESVFMGIEWIQLAYNVSEVPGQEPRQASELTEMEVDSDGEANSLGDAEVLKGGKKKGKGKHRGKGKNKMNEKCQRPCWLDDV